MNGVAGIDAGSAWLARDNSPASPVQDFADELTRDTPHAAAHAPPANAAPRDMKAAAPTAEQIDQDASDGRADDAVQAALPADALSELSSAQQQVLQPVAPVGITEAFIGARVFGLHLAAQGYLSVLSAAQLSDDAKAPGVAQDDVATAMGEHAADTNVAVTQSPASMATASTTVAVGAGAQAEPPAVSGLDNASVPPVLEIAAGAAAISWPERVVRSVRDANQGVSIWLRDYRTTPEETSKLVGELAEHARAHGERLNRILLNGREVWTSRGGTNQGVTHVG